MNENAVPAIAEAGVEYAPVPGIVTTPDPTIVDIGVLNADELRTTAVITPAPAITDGGVE
jgi:hypothetical protein